MSKSDAFYWRMTWQAASSSQVRTSDGGPYRDEANVLAVVEAAEAQIRESGHRILRTTVKRVRGGLEDGQKTCDDYRFYHESN